MKKIALITGGAGGIGKEICKAFGRDGYTVIVNYHHNKIGAEALIKELNQKDVDAFAVKADISQRKEVEEMVDIILKRYGHLDVLVNNAGIAQQKLFTDISVQEWNRMFDVNVTGAFHCIQCVLPNMIQNQSGKIINISSVWGVTGASCEVHYSTSKAALIGLTKALAKEVGLSGITVNCVAPGVIDTKMNSGLDEVTLFDLKESTPLGSIGKPKDVAEVVLFLASEKAEFITGQVISPNGGFVI